MNMRKILNKLLKKEEGNVAVIVAAGMAALIGIAAMAVDAGQLYFEKSQLQKTVDAAALAGAQVYYVDSGAPAAEAVEVAGANGYVIDSGNVELGESYVRVSHSSEVSLTFARVLGFQTADVHATAAAAIYPLSKSIFAAPIAVQESHIPNGEFLNCENPGNAVDRVNFNSKWTGSSSEAYKTAFKKGYADGFEDGYERKTPASLPDEPSGDSEKGYKEGYEDGYEDGEDAFNDPGQRGNCGYLATGGTGGSNLYDAFTNGVEYDLSDIVNEDPDGPNAEQEDTNTEPGKKHGQVSKAVNDLIAEDSGKPHCQSPDTADNSCSRVIIVAVVADGTFDTISGRDSVEIIGFASYWLKGMGNGQNKHRIIGHFIDMVTLGEGEEGIPEHGAYNVRLID
ncbi:hypothetical protein C6Y45_07100 [Alkalicoccus saliphilus]|uniref:Putative Flp pilus-assembly TadG-like N-terminal domain-containing protein n=1 Tax=Alkalicoccus saliphilus TaxID=200989 RepID=A0A2T4U6Y7_9BACI|nr:hypothetical protein C6Y45_07100 [Alkalicoccus saliphilus]